MVSRPFSFSASMTSLKPSTVSCDCAAGVLGAAAGADSVTIAMLSSRRNTPAGEAARSGSAGQWGLR
jgi:hypothetical protein